MVHLRHHLRHRLRWVFISACGALLAGAATLAYAAADVAPTIIFNGAGTPPLTCTSTPDISGISIHNGTRLTVENLTDVDAVVIVDQSRGASLEPGQAASVKVRKGQHSLRLWPMCLAVQSVGALSITVDPAPPMPYESTPTPSGSASNATAPPSGPATPALVGPSRSGVARAGGHPSGGPRTGSSRQEPVTDLGPAATPEARTSPASAEAGSLLDGSQEPGEYGSPFFVDGPAATAGGHLLGIIALICVLGVTAGIIRAILSQRADGAVGT